VGGPPQEGDQERTAPHDHPGIQKPNGKCESDGPQASGEVRNLLCVARLLTAAALERRESRGGHYRSDFPAPDPAWQRRLYLTAAPDGSARFEPAEMVSPALAAAGARS